MNQKTIVESAQLEGIGLHTGKIVKITFRPAEVNHGIKFCRIDLPNKPIIAADVSKVFSTNRGTTLMVNDVYIHTVEHLLSALAGARVDNILVEIDGPEIPIMDGSAMPFFEAIKKAGLLEQDQQRDYFVIEEMISLKDDITGCELIAYPDKDFSVTTLIDFNSPVLGQQFARIDSLDDYEKEIAMCRTFVFVHELEVLLNQGLIKGGDLNNAIVIAERELDKEELNELSKKLGKSNQLTVKEGVLNTIDLKFKNEPARHKLLDVIGDLTLLGKPIKGKIVSIKPGHTINVEFTKLLKKNLLEKKRLKGKPHYDPEVEPVLDISGIMKMLPHRFPFLLIDKIIELKKEIVVGIKNISFTEPCFEGHFPNNPVYPGVLQIEAMAQTGGILALSQVKDPENWDTYFVKIENAKFKYKVLPGDTMIIKMELIDPIRRGICHMAGNIYIGNRVVCEADLTAQIINRTIQKE